MLPDGIRTYLLTQTTVTALAPSQVVSGIPFPAVFVDNPPQGVVPPYVKIVSNGTDPMMTLDPTYNDTLIGDDIDFVCYGTSATNARALSDAVQAVFQDYSGAAGSSNTIKAVTWTDENYGYDYPDDGRDVKYHKITTSYHVQSTPH